MEATNKFVLKYTDAGIQKPEMSTRLHGGHGGHGGHGFPKLVTRYISKKNKDGGGTFYIETFRQNSKLAVVTQSFM